MYILRETSENVLIRAYSKIMKDDRTRIRLERQEYPRASLADIIEQKLSSDKRILKTIGRHLFQQILI